MTILSLAVEASGMRRGVEEGVAALGNLGRAAENTGRAVDNAAKQVSVSLDQQAERTRKFNNSIQAVGEITQVSQRVRLLGEEVRNLGSGFSNASSIANLFSQSLIDVQQLSIKATGGVRGFVDTLKQNPLLATATALQLASVSMSAFGKETAIVNTELERQIQAQRDLQRSLSETVGSQQLQEQLRAMGVGDTATEDDRQRAMARRLVEQAARIRQSESPGNWLRFADVSTLTGVTEEQFLARYRTPLERGATAYDPKTGRLESITNETAAKLFLEIAQEIAKTLRRPGDYNVPLPPGYQPPMTGEELARYQREFGLPSVEAQPSFNYNVPLPPGYQPPMTEEELARYQSRFAPPTVLPKPTSATTQEGEGFNFKLTEVAIEQAEKRVAEFNERMRELKALGQDVGTAIGSAFFSIVNGAASARQALAALLQQFIAIAQQRAIQGIANSIGNYFGASAGQNASNAAAASPPPASYYGY